MAQETEAALPVRLPTYAASYDAETDKDLRLAVLTKLFNLYPLYQHQELRLAMLGYYEELEDVATWALDLACRRLVRQPGRVFRPTVGELRSAAALVVWIKTQSISPDRKASDDPVSRRMVKMMLERGRKMVGHPDPEPGGGFLSPQVRGLVDSTAAVRRLNTGEGER